MSHSSDSSVDLVRPRVQRAVDRLRLRGPDAQGLCQFDNAVLGHARLAVIDPVGGQQPLHDPESGVALTYNGEIYNFRELRSELESKGRTFQTNCDTEVVLQAWLEWGTTCFERFNGFFALGIFDPETRKIILARDRLGLKPLYYAVCGEGLAFASSIPALFDLIPEVERPGFCRIDLPVMSHYLTTRLWSLNGRTLLDGVSLLGPGSWTSCSADLDEPVERLYWELPKIPVVDKDSIEFTEAVGETRQLLEDAVTKRLISDVPLGAFLSGGLDSSIITSVASSRHDVALPLFCAGSDSEELNEYAYANMMADELGLDLTTVLIDAAGFRDKWRFLIREKGLPLSTPNEVSILRLASALREQCTVTLTGEGADEVFGGYIRPQFGAYDYDRTPRHPDDVDEDGPLTWALRMANGRAWFMNDVDHMLTCDSWVGLPAKMRLLLPATWDELDEDAEMLCTYEDFFDALDGCSTFDKRMHLHTRFNLENLLLRVDSSTMAASVEARVPFTDHRLVEHAFRMPDAFKMDFTNDYAREKGATLPVSQIDQDNLLTTKRLPRAAFQTDLPDEILARKKMSFPVPFSRWFSGPMAEELRELCLNSELSAQYFSTTELERMFERKDMNLWLVCNLCLWWDEISQMSFE